MGCLVMELLEIILDYCNTSIVVRERAMDGKQPQSIKDIMNWVLPGKHDEVDRDIDCKIMLAIASRR